MPNNTALLIIDVQTGMFTYEPPPLYRREQLLNALERLIGEAEAKAVPVIYVQHDGGPGDDLEANTPGWELHPRIKPSEGEVVVQKRTPDSFYETDLQEQLEKLQVTDLVVAGLQTEFCVDATCRRAADLGYKVTLVKDAHSTFDSASMKADQIIEQYNTELEGRGVQLKALAEVEFGEKGL